MGSDALYNEQALLRKAVCFVWAVTCVRADQSAFMRAYRIREARGSYGQSVRPIMSKRSYGKRCAFCGL